MGFQMFSFGIRCIWICEIRIQLIRETFHTGVGLLLLLKFIQKLDPPTFCSSSVEQLRDCRRQQWDSCPLSPSLCNGDGYKEEQPSGSAVIQCEEEKRASPSNRRPVDTTQPLFSGNRANVTRMEPRGVAVLSVCCRLVYRSGYKLPEVRGQLVCRRG